MLAPRVVHEDVELAIVVVIYESHAATHSLEDVGFSVNAALDHGHMQPRLWGDAP